MKQLYLVRHGQTILNHFQKMQGWVDSPLTEKGESQATQTGKRLKDIHFDLIGSSDLGRAIATRDLIAAQNNDAPADLQTFKDFREVYFGVFEGEDSVKTWNMIGGPIGSRDQNVLIKKYGFLKVRDFMHDTDPFKEAESGEQLKDRIDSAISTIQELLKDNEKALIVSHGTFIRNVAAMYSDGSSFIEQPDNGSITVLDITDTPELIEYNKTN
ncbi:histidine phosphatase family protein [Lentilactobacillus sp. Marseille-Q4993]|uniref:histidine phosphatase family protein n=1 Tax=Lentilactobacillus sp. Marseille-Q4993 TaxID=3039492 RepID=UPI0024BC0B05|nr:histidine phosphatase family protein [Lentilactobacillus sp. Marseille-Q4993]